MAKMEGRGMQGTELFTVIVQVFPTWSKKCKITSGKSGSQGLSWEVAFCCLCLTPHTLFTPTGLLVEPGRTECDVGQANLQID